MGNQCHTLRNAYRLTLAAITCYALSGCTIIGYFAGRAIDESSTGEVHAAMGTALSLRPGDDVQVTDRQGGIIEGTYMVSASMDSSAYAQRYADFLARLKPSVNMPGPGEELLISTGAGELRSKCMFRGFGNGTMKALVQNDVDARIVEFAFSHLASVKTPGGRSFDLPGLQRMSQAGELPRDVTLVIDVEGSISRIPLDDVQYVVKPRSKYSRWILMGVGLLVDVVIMTQIFPLKMFDGPIFEGDGHFF